MCYCVPDFACQNQYNFFQNIFLLVCKYTKICMAIMQMKPNIVWLICQNLKYVCWQNIAEWYVYVTFENCDTLMVFTYNKISIMSNMWQNI